MRLHRRVLRALRGSPLPVQVLLGAVVIVLAWAAVNGVYQTIRKPTELFFPVSGSLVKTPSETWRTYGPLFRKHSTAVITPDFLAALAQVEGGGNPVARTYWRWRPVRNPFELYRPASSAVGMYQITDGTFHEAKRYCIHDHVVVEDGPWDDVRSCWFNSLYTRVVPSHAIELTAALLDRNVARALERRRIGSATLRQKQNLAAVIHLCGAGTGQTYTGRGFRLTPGRRCGDHDVGAYLARVNGLQRRFAAMEAGGVRTPSEAGLAADVIGANPQSPARSRSSGSPCRAAKTTPAITLCTEQMVNDLAKCGSGHAPPQRMAKLKQ